MKLKHLSFLMFAVVLLFPPTVGAADMEIVVWVPADQNERYRFEAVAHAANVLNEELKIEGRDVKVSASSGESERVAAMAATVNVEQVPQYAPIKYAGHEAGDFLFVPAVN